MIASVLANASIHMFERFEIDDPIGSISVHGLGGVWGMVACGFFVRPDNVARLNGEHVGLFHGGSAVLLGIQVLAVACIISWSAGLAFIITALLKVSPLGLRMSEEEEEEGADQFEHGVAPRSFLASKGTRRSSTKSPKKSSKKKSSVAPGKLQSALQSVEETVSEASDDKSERKSIDMNTDAIRVGGDSYGSLRKPRSFDAARGNEGLLSWKT